MSQYCLVKTQFNLAEALIAAMMDTTPAWTRERIEVHEEPQHLMGYHDDTREQRAHIVVRRQFVQDAANDLGFERKEDGTFELHVSNYDRGSTGQGTYGDAWLKRLKQNYSYHRVKLQQEALGRTVSRQPVPGTQRQQVLVVGYR